MTSDRLEPRGFSTEYKIFDEHTGEPKPTQSTEEVVYVTKSPTDIVTTINEDDEYDMYHGEILGNLYVVLNHTL
jgi:hypothetical protein